MTNASWTPLGRGDGYEYSVTVLSVFWPQAEHAKLIPVAAPHGPGRTDLG